MDFYEAVKSRRTIRDFTDKTPDKKTIERILSAGLAAPSNDHMRDWEFVVLTDREIIEKIINPIPKTISEKRVDFIIDSMKVNAPIQKEAYQHAIPKQHEMLVKSGCLILPFYKQHWPLLKPKNLSALNSFASIWCCLENIMLAVTAEKLGYAMRIPFDKETEHIFETLKHPKDYVMPCYLAIGYPSPGVKSSKQIKHRIKDKIHYNQW